MVPARTGTPPPERWPCEHRATELILRVYQYLSAEVNLLKLSAVRLRSFLCAIEPSVNGFVTVGEVKVVYRTEQWFPPVFDVGEFFAGSG